MKKVVIPAMLALFSVFFLNACKPEQKTVAPMPPSPVVIVEAKKLDCPRYLECLGTTHSLQSVDIVPQVSGQIMKVPFTQGEIIREGEIIAEIDSRPYDAAVKQAKALLNQYEAQLKIDELEVKRNEKLVKDSYIDRQTYDTYLAKVEMDKALVESAKAGLIKAQIDLDWCVIKAPFTGKIGFRELDVGNVAKAGTSRITTIEQVDTLYIDFVVPSQHLYEARTFMEKNGGFLDLQIKYIEATMRDKVLNAKAKIVQNKIRYKSGTAIIRGEIDNKNGLFWPNQPVKVNMIFEVMKDAILIPYAAVETGPNETKYVYAADVVEWPVRLVKKYPVKIIQINDDSTCVVQGIPVGANVITMGQLAVSMGAYALAYSSTIAGMPYGKDGKTIEPASIRDFLGSATMIAEKLRAQKAQANGAKAPQQAPVSKPEEKSK